jgi:hypothetical protein
MGHAIIPRAGIPIRIPKVHRLIDDLGKLSDDLLLILAEEVMLGCFFSANYQVGWIDASSV